MSRLTESKHPAYHLRPNKAIDRSIFLELLHVLNSYESLNNHTYIGLGGAYLEDFRLLGNAFHKIQMISIEKEEEIFKRQAFHKCTSRITLHNCDIEQFLSSKFPSDSPTITWADYTGFNRQVLLEASDIARKSIPLSVVRITVCAESPIYYQLKLGNRRPKDMPPYLEKEFAAFQSSFKNTVDIEDTSPGDKLFTWNNFKEDNFPTLLSQIISTIISSSCTRPKSYLPIHSVKYSDGTIMLSITGIICHEEERENLKNHFQSNFEFFSFNAQVADTIDVPFLTTKERLYLESEIPVSEITGKVTFDRLGYLIEGQDSARLSKYKMAQYEKYHRLYPYFGKLVP
jgi:hypothetical protein